MWHGLERATGPLYPSLSSATDAMLLTLTLQITLITRENCKVISTGPGTQKTLNTW